MKTINARKGGKKSGGEDVRLENLRRACAFVLANAVSVSFPEAVPVGGSVTPNGFFYDFDFRRPFNADDIKSIEKEMRKITGRNEKFEKQDVPGERIRGMFTNAFKREALGEEPRLYQLGGFRETASGELVCAAGIVSAFKLTSASPVYWKGDSNNPQLQRVYGVAFGADAHLQDFLARQAEADARDHRKIGKKLGLFFFPETSPGGAIFLPKGAAMVNALQGYLRGVYTSGEFGSYSEVNTPQLYDRSLWETSGHWPLYKKEMFVFENEGKEYALKPMNCPSHCLIYQNEPRSYKDLPLRIADFGCLHRNELSGALSGLLRVRKLSQDDAHIFCRPDQIEDEIRNVLKFSERVWTEFLGFDLKYVVSTRPRESIGSDELWEKAESRLEMALKNAGIPYGINQGDGAFYGPKIDMYAKDALGREWQGPTVQLDFNLPERFGLEYIDENGQKQRPVMIHRVVLGSLERFIGVITEHFGGRFPLWLSPEQVRVVSVSESFVPFAKSVVKALSDSGMRVGSDFERESVSRKIREAQTQYVNYTVVIGAEETVSGRISVRNRDTGEVSKKSIEEFIYQLTDEIRHPRKPLAPREQ